MKSCITGDWDSGSLAFAISRGLPLRAAPVFEHSRRYSWHAFVPITFRIRVSHRAQELPSESLLTELGIRQGASRRTSLVLAPHLHLPQHHAVRMIEGRQQVTAVLFAMAGA